VHVLARARIDMRVSVVDRAGLSVGPAEVVVREGPMSRRGSGRIVYRGMSHGNGPLSAVIRYEYGTVRRVGGPDRRLIQISATSKGRRGEVAIEPTEQQLAGAEPLFVRVVV
jgi:hypothetical protein